MNQVVILGSTSLLGLAIARRFAAAGFELVLVARDVDSLYGVEFGQGVEVSLIAVDFANPDAVARFFLEMKVLQPAVVISLIGRQEESNRDRDDGDYISSLITANFIVPAQILERFATQMMVAGRGTLIGISSVAGDRGRARNYTYGAAKSGFSAFLSGLRQRLAGTGVHVITVKPGPIASSSDLPQTSRRPRALLGSADRVADDVLQGYRSGKNVVYSPGYWRWVMLLVRLLPEWLFKRLSF